MTTQRPHILITNDDGVHAPGIKNLWKALSAHAHLTVVAPASEQSAVGLCSTIRHPLLIEKVRWESHHESIWSVSGTPSDCVKLALNAILQRRPDIVVSGINRGTNAGRNVLYSGTVAAAIESILQELPAIAFSCLDYSVEPDFPTISTYIPTIVDYVLKHPLPSGTLLNVNFPERQLGPIKGVKMTSQGTEWWAENPDKRTHPGEGHDYYWLGSQIRSGKEKAESDSVWLRRGYVTAVPVKIGDLTDHGHLSEAQDRFERSF